MPVSIRDLIFTNDPNNRPETALPVIGGASSLTVYQQIHNEVLSPTALTIEFASGSPQTITRDAIGVTSTDGLILINNTAAAAAAQQWSPRLRFTGRGWKTNATAASQTVDWIIETVPVEGAANPTVDLTFSSQVNAGGYTSRMRLISTGEMALTGPLTVTGTGANTMAGIVNVTVADTSALAVGRTGAWALQVDTNTASSVTGLKVTAAALTNGLALAVIGGTNENLTLDAQGSGTITFNGTATGAVIFGQNIQMNQAASTIRPGATSFALRNNADNADNLLVTDAGVVTARSTLTATSGLVMNAGSISLKQSGNINGVWMNSDTASFNSDVMRLSSRMASGTGFNLLAVMNAADANGFGTVVVSIRGDGLITCAGLSITDAKDVALGTTTGTKIGTATTQKLGLYNATPIVQGAAVADASGGATIDAEARTAINTLLTRVRLLGVIAT